VFLGAAPPLTHSHVELTQSSQPGDAILGLFVNDELKSSLSARWQHYGNTPKHLPLVCHFHTFGVDCVWFTELEIRARALM
jgi:hypothetical protein